MIPPASTILLTIVIALSLLLIIIIIISSMVIIMSIVSLWWSSSSSPKSSFSSLPLHPWWGLGLHLLVSGLPISYSEGVTESATLNPICYPSTETCSGTQEHMFVWEGWGWMVSSYQTMEEGFRGRAPLSFFNYTLGLQKCPFMDKMHFI